MSGQSGFSDGVALFLFCALSFQSVCPLRNHCSLVQRHSACAGFSWSPTLLLLLYFLLHLLFFVCLSISCVFPATRRRFFGALLTPPWWDGQFVAWPPESLGMPSEGGTFGVFLDHMLVTVAQRLRLSMSQTHVQLSQRCHFPRTRC